MNKKRLLTVMGGSKKYMFSDDFVRDDGAIGNDWVGSSWTIASNKALNTPTLSDELALNPTMAGTYVAGLAPNWQLLSGITLTEENTIVYQGTQSQKCVQAVGGSGSILCKVSQTVAQGRMYKVVAQVYIETVGGRVGFVRGTVYEELAMNGRFTTTVGEWVTIETDSWIIGDGAVSALGGISSITNDCTYYIGGFSIKQVTNFAALRKAVPNIKASLVVDVNTMGYAGIMILANSDTNPTSWVTAYLVEHPISPRINIFKFVGGVCSSVLGTVAVYAEGAAIRLEYNPSTTTLYLYYNEALIGSYTVSDAALTTGAYAGMFSSNPASLFSRFEAVKYGMSFL